MVDALQAQITRMPEASLYLHVTSYSSIHHDAFCFGSNQAALASIRKFSVGGYGERRFLLNELGSYRMAIALPIASSVFGFTATYSGSSLYNESVCGLAYGRSLGKIDMGMQFNYIMVKASGYGRSSGLNMEAGVIAHLTDRLQTGIHVFNPFPIDTKAADKFSFLYAAGFGYDVSDQFFISAEIKKTADEPVTINTGFQYAFEKKLFVRAGIASATSSFCFGLGFLWNGFRIDALVSTHPQLGMSPAIMILYNDSDQQ
jgi:hypothetical protein